VKQIGVDKIVDKNVASTHRTNGVR
jgi:hypothetical protein